MRKFLSFAVTLSLLGMVTACSTVEGVGKDLNRLGTSIEKVAKDEKKRSN